MLKRFLKVTLIALHLSAFSLNAHGFSNLINDIKSQSLFVAINSLEIAGLHSPYKTVIDINAWISFLRDTLNITSLVHPLANYSKEPSSLAYSGGLFKFFLSLGCARDDVRISDNAHLIAQFNKNQHTLDKKALIKQYGWLTTNFIIRLIALHSGRANASTVAESKPFSTGGLPTFIYGSIIQSISESFRRLNLCKNALKKAKSINNEKNHEKTVTT